MSALSWQIRPFVRNDQHAARQLILAGLGEHFGAIDPTRNPDLDDIWADYIARGDLFVVAEVGPTLVATGAMRAEAADPAGECGRIVRVSVERDYRQHGIGRAIVAHLVQAARVSGWTRLLVETNHDWHAAVALYRRCGFQPYDRDEESVHLALALG